MSNVVRLPSASSAALQAHKLAPLLMPKRVALVGASPKEGTVGNGMIVERGFRRPPSYHTQRLRRAPAGHIFDVMTHGFGAMPSYARIEPHDRWAIVAYIRVLQLSQNATLEDVPPSERGKLGSAADGDDRPTREGEP